MSHKDIKPLKEKIWKFNNCECPVLKYNIPLNKMVLDHNHKRKDEPYSEHKGTIRTALDFRVNAVLGKLENSIKRTGLDKEEYFNIGDFLRNAADYFENGPWTEEGYHFIHPREVPKRKRVGKREYNKVKKYYFKLFPNRKKMLKKPTYVTEKWIELVKQIDEYIERENK